jgi:sigma-B regulation protein RsbU (phosphoserine phosphatase)
MIGVPKSVAFADINRRLSHNLAALGLATLVALAAAWFGGKFILRQVDALVAATRKLASGDLGARASLRGGRSELDSLAHAFNSMAATLEVRDRELRAAEEKTRAAEIELAVSRAHMDIAKQIQRSLLPEVPLTLAGVRIAGRCIPAAEVGGDYFGYFARGLHGVDSFVGDVSGHGVGAALLMSAARTTFLAERLIEPNPSAAQILTKLNDLLFDDLDRAGLFITASCATLDAATRELSYANAGHPPALLLRAGETTSVTVTADGMLLGLRKAVEFAEVKVMLHADDIVVFYTDGITDTRNEAGELFGTDRLGETVAANRNEDPEMLVDVVLATLNRFAGVRQPDDDVTLVVMKLTG